MTTLKVKIDDDKDLSSLTKVISEMGFEYSLNEDDEEDWGDLPEAAIESIKAGLADSEAGRVYSHEYAMDQINETLKRLRKTNG
jgi:predicted transcriptional regulator